MNRGIRVRTRYVFGEERNTNKALQNTKRLVPRTQTKQKKGVAIKKNTRCWLVVRYGNEGGWSVRLGEVDVEGDILMKAQTISFIEWHIFCVSWTWSVVWQTWVSFSHRLGGLRIWLNLALVLSQFLFTRLADSRKDRRGNTLVCEESVYLNMGLSLFVYMAFSDYAYTSTDLCYVGRTSFSFELGISYPPVYIFYDLLLAYLRIIRFNICGS